MTTEEYESECKSLKERLDYLEANKPIEQWEPKGNWFINGYGDIIASDVLADKKHGSFSLTRKAAEKMSKAMRQFNRLLAYKDEFEPDFKWIKTENNCYVCFANDQWRIASNPTYNNPTNVYFSKNQAEILVDKLNSKEVVL